MPDKDCCPEDIRKPVSVPTLLTQTASKVKKTKPVSVPTLLTQTALKVNKTKTGLIPDPA